MEALCWFALWFIVLMYEAHLKEKRNRLLREHEASEQAKDFLIHCFPDTAMQMGLIPKEKAP